MLRTLVTHFFDRRWVCARVGSPNPVPTSFPKALFEVIATGGELLFVG